MKKEVISGKWDQIKGKVKEKWGKLTDDDLTTINGKKDQLVGKLKEKYGWEKDRAEKEIGSLEASWEDHDEGNTHAQK